MFMLMKLMKLKPPLRNFWVWPLLAVMEVLICFLFLVESTSGAIGFGTNLLAEHGRRSIKEWKPRHEVSPQEKRKHSTSRGQHKRLLRRRRPGINNGADSREGDRIESAKVEQQAAIDGGISHVAAFPARQEPSLSMSMLQHPRNDLNEAIKDHYAVVPDQVAHAPTTISGWRSTTSFLSSRSSSSAGALSLLSGVGKPSGQQCSNYRFCREKYFDSHGKDNVVDHRNRAETWYNPSSPPSMMCCPGRMNVMTSTPILNIDELEVEDPDPGSRRATLSKMNSNHFLGLDSCCLQGTTVLESAQEEETSKRTTKGHGKGVVFREGTRKELIQSKWSSPLDRQMNMEFWKQQRNADDRMIAYLKRTGQDQDAELMHTSSKKKFMDHADEEKLQIERKAGDQL
ncbi:unnamed protein product [Amoebophrya sp. A120]|nr:unnamed protein product [Amoebophrya sp. A120]|eukprot:GSA120T00015608001.1